MPRRDRMSSRKRFFEEHHFGDEHEYTADDSGNTIGTAADSANIPVKRRGNTNSARQSFFQNLGNEGTSGNNEIHARATVDSSTFEAENLNSGSDSEQSDSGVIDHAEIVDNVLENLDNLSSFGQARYQNQRQGVIVEYKDFGDNSFQCIHCKAYYWWDERNSRGIYTGCCMGGQVRLPPSKPIPAFLRHLLDPNTGAKGWS